MTRERPLAKRQRQVLEAAASLAKPGEPVTTKAIAEVIGDITANHVSLTVGRLKKNGLWKYADPRAKKPPDITDFIPAKPTPDHEDKAATLIHDLLLRFPDATARRRVISSVARKMAEG